MTLPIFPVKQKNTALKILFFFFTTILPAHGQWNVVFEVGQTKIPGQDFSWSVFYESFFLSNDTVYLWGETDHGGSFDIPHILRYQSGQLEHILDGRTQFPDGGGIIYRAIDGRILSDGDFYAILHNDDSPAKTVIARIAHNETEVVLPSSQDLLNIADPIPYTDWFVSDDESVFVAGGGEGAIYHDDSGTNIIVEAGFTTLPGAEEWTVQDINLIGISPNGWDVYFFADSGTEDSPEEVQGLYVYRHPLFDPPIIPDPDPFDPVQHIERIIDSTMDEPGVYFDSLTSPAQLVGSDGTLYFQLNTFPSGAITSFLYAFDIEGNLNLIAQTNDTIGSVTLGSIGLESHWTFEGGNSVLYG